MLALLADLHANREALEAVLDDVRAQGATRLALLGDFVGYGADPGWVVDTVRELVADGAVAVLGNHDEAVVRGPRPTMRPVPRRAVEWTRQQLDAGQLAFLAGLPLQIDDGVHLFVHANAFEPAQWEYLVEREEVLLSFDATPRTYTFCGHVHEPRLFQRPRGGRHIGAFTPVAGVPIPVPPHRQWLALPGSVGQPRDGNPAACWAAFDLARQQITFHRVPYDAERAAAKVQAAGLPQSLARRLEDGD